MDLDGTLGGADGSRSELITMLKINFKLVDIFISVL